MLPKDFTPGKKYPLVVNVHGGPSSACTPHWDAKTMGPESAMGYFAFCPNPRGSYGQGEAFTRGNIKDFGGGDFRDIMTGVDAILKQYPVDPHRIGIRGHSYGGYMTMWAETQTQRFAAAVAGAGLSDWLSYYGVNDIDEWMIPFFGASVYDDPAVYAKSDPIHFVKAVKTPTLVLVGDRDGEVPMEQSVEWWHALKDAEGSGPARRLPQRRPRVLQARRLARLFRPHPGMVRRVVQQGPGETSNSRGMRGRAASRFGDPLHRGHHPERSRFSGEVKDLDLALAADPNSPRVLAVPLERNLHIALSHQPRKLFSPLDQQNAVVARRSSSPSVSNSRGVSMR